MADFSLAVAALVANFEEVAQSTDIAWGDIVLEAVASFANFG